MAPAGTLQCPSHLNSANHKSSRLSLTSNLCVNQYVPRLSTTTENPPQLDRMPANSKCGRFLWMCHKTSSISSSLSRSSSNSSIPSSTQNKSSSHHLASTLCPVQKQHGAHQHHHHHHHHQQHRSTNQRIRVVSDGKCCDVDHDGNSVASVNDSHHQLSNSKPHLLACVRHSAVTSQPNAIHSIQGNISGVRECSDLL